MFEYTKSMKTRPMVHSLSYNCVYVLQKVQKMSFLEHLDLNTLTSHVSSELLYAHALALWYFRHNLWAAIVESTRW